MAAPHKLWRMFAHIFIIMCGYFACRGTASIPIMAITALIIGHSLACIGFLVHELAHNGIVRSRLPRYCLEVFFFGLNFIPATMWQRVHNQTHHLHTNTLNDPDRKFFKSEESLLTRWYSRMLYPQQRAIHWSPLVFFHFVAYVIRNTIAAFYPNSMNPALVPFKPPYTLRLRTKIFAEVAFIVALQVGIFHLVGARWDIYLWVSPVAILITSSIVNTYVFTQHFSNPIGEFTDPLAASTSVIVPSLFDRVHSNFSYHTEHHCFPHMNSDFYPQLSVLLQQQYPDRYHRVPIGKAWRSLWQGEEFMPNLTKET